VIPSCAHDDEYGTHGNFGTLLKLLKFFSEFGGHIIYSNVCLCKMPCPFSAFFPLVSIMGKK
jgi:hypothetical protein